MLEQDLVKAIKEIDPSLKYVNWYRGASLYVCKVTEKNTPYIFKMFDSYAMPDVRDSLYWGRKQFRNEYRALKKLNGIPGSPLLFHYYNKGRYQALIKEFIDGEKAYSLGVKKELVIKRFLNLYHNMIKKGILFFDFKPDNIIITKEHQPYIIDFGNVKFREDLNPALEKCKLINSHKEMQAFLEDKI